MSPLLPRYWLNRSATVLTADDYERFGFPYWSYLQEIDEQNKTIRYRCLGDDYEFSYALE